MATKSVRATVDAAGSARAELVADVGTAAAAVSKTAVNAAMATLQADGATPTEAHVDTADTALIAYVAAVDASLAASGAATGGVQVTVDTAVITNLNKLKAALDAIYVRFAGSGMAAG